jgi:hypothetical protein
LIFLKLAGAAGARPRRARGRLRLIKRRRGAAAAQDQQARFALVTRGPSGCGIRRRHRGSQRARAGHAREAPRPGHGCWSASQARTRAWRARPTPRVAGALPLVRRYNDVRSGVC